MSRHSFAPHLFVALLLVISFPSHATAGWFRRADQRTITLAKIEGPTGEQNLLLADEEAVSTVASTPIAIISILSTAISSAPDVSTPVIAATTSQPSLHPTGVPTRFINSTSAANATSIVISPTTIVGTAIILTTAPAANTTSPLEPAITPSTNVSTVASNSSAPTGTAGTTGVPAYVNSTIKTWASTGVFHHHPHHPHPHPHHNATRTRMWGTTGVHHPHNGTRATAVKPWGTTGVSTHHNASRHHRPTGMPFHRPSFHRPGHHFNFTSTCAPANASTIYLTVTEIETTVSTLSGNGTVSTVTEVLFPAEAPTVTTTTVTETSVSVRRTTATFIHSASPVTFTVTHTVTKTPASSATPTTTEPVLTVVVTPSPLSTSRFPGFRIGVPLSLLGIGIGGGGQV